MDIVSAQGIFVQDNLKDSLFFFLSKIDIERNRESFFTLVCTQTGIVFFMNLPERGWMETMS